MGGLALLRAAVGRDGPYSPVDSGGACWLHTETPACLPSSVLAKWPWGKVVLWQVGRHLRLWQECRNCSTSKLSGRILRDTASVLLREYCALQEQDIWAQELSGSQAHIVSCELGRPHGETMVM